MPFDLARIIARAWRGRYDATEDEIEAAVREQLAAMPPVRFEGTGIETEAERLEAFVEAGIPRVRLLSMRDKTTCEVCRAADGVEMTLAKARRAQPLPHAGCACPEGVCRCTYLPLTR